MREFLKAGAFLASALVFPTIANAQGAGDLLVAPTRVVLDGSRGTEVILNNIGSTTATYRISLELRRMQPDGSLDDVDLAKANALETTTLGMISYAPRRVVLPPNQPQSIRIGIRAPQGLADGEYRAHMLFRAIPAPRAATDKKPSGEGVSIALTPIYGITIPIIVRQGSLSAKAAITDAKIVETASGSTLNFGMTRSGNRSTYGRIRVIKAGIVKPLIDARGVAIYADVGERRVIFPIDTVLLQQLRGPVTIQYLEDVDSGGGMIAELQTVIR